MTGTGKRRLLRCAMVWGLMLWVLLGTVPATAYADTATSADAASVVDPTGADEGYSAVLYDNENGLPTSEANAIAETSEGFIWIGSYSGLMRYDGNTFERTDSTTGVASVVSLYVDDTDRLWVGTNDSGVAVMERGEFRFLDKDDGLPSLSVRAITGDREGNIYVGTTQGIVLVDPQMRTTPLDDVRVRDKYVRDLRLGADGLIYGVTRNDEVFTVEGGRVRDFLASDELGMPSVSAVLPDPGREGFVYLSTSESSVYYGKLSSGLAKAKVTDVSPLANVKSVELIGERLWVCADNGIGFVEDGKARRLDNVPLANSIDHVMADYEGNLWFTSSRQGVMKIVPNQFSDIFDRYGLEPAVVNTTALMDGRLYIGTDAGLTVLDGAGVVRSIPLTEAKSASGTDLGEDDLVSMMRDRRIRSIVHDEEGNLWFSTYGDYGLVRYRDGAATCFTQADGLPSERVRCVHERRNGSVLVACTGGLAVIEGDEVVASYDAANNLTNTEILTVAEAKNGDVVLGSDGDGIYVLEGTRRTHYTRHVDLDDGLSSGVVMRVKYDPARDVFWIVTSNSIAYMDASYRVTTIREFPYSNNFDLYENKDGEMWVLSSNGIYVVSADSLLSNGEVSPVYYGADNGLPCIATANSYSELTDDGDLYIAGTTGVAKVNIDVPFEDVRELKTAVPFVKAGETMLYPDKDGAFQLTSGTSRLTVYPFVYNYSLLNPQVSYHLEGFEDKVTTVRRSELGPIDYTNLPGGTYRFVLQVRDAMGHGNKELSVTIVKQMGVTESPWFRLLVMALVGLAAGLLVRLFYRRRTRELERKQMEHRVFIREMIEAFAKVIDMKDKYTNGHSTRVAEYTVMLTRELGYDEETIERYYNIALLHDIGKIGVPEEVLNKPGKLTDHEFNIIKSHSSLGYRTLKDISIMPELATGAGAHHERPDGRGYPRGLTGDEIPRVAQIIAVADTFDAMYSDRPYRKRMNFDKAVSIIREVRGTQLTEDVVDAFLRLVDKGEFRAPDDVGGGTTEDIDNIHRRQQDEG